MIFATVRSGILEATLRDDGWHCDAAIVARLLNQLCSLSEFGPADGDPVACAADAAARLLGGKATYIRPVPSYPADAVF